MPEYRFFKKGRQVIAVERTDTDVAFQLAEQGYEKQFEEVYAADKRVALARFADIRREKRIDQRNFLSGAATMPLIGVMTAIAYFFLRKGR